MMIGLKAPAGLEAFFLRFVPGVLYLNYYIGNILSYYHRLFCERPLLRILMLSY